MAAMCQNLLARYDHLFEFRIHHPLELVEPTNKAGSVLSPGHLEAIPLRNPKRAGGPLRRCSTQRRRNLPNNNDETPCNSSSRSAKRSSTTALRLKRGVNGDRGSR
jgi:hypothetical protein